MFERKQRQPYSLGLIVAFGVAASCIAYLVVSRGISRRGNEATTEQATSGKPKDRLPAEWFFMMREFPDFTTNLSTYDQVLEEASMAAQKRGSYPGFQAPWITQGPGNIGARVNTIAVHPTNPNIIYIGYSTGGVWKTTNGGQDWAPIFDGQNYMSIGDITLDPSNPNTVYVGTGDLNISGYPFVGDGIWKSTNGGQTWTYIGLANTRVTSKVIVHPTNPAVIYAATMGEPFKRTPNRGLYRTNNGGQTWEKVLFINEQTGIIDLEMDPNNPNILYAAAWTRIRNNQESLISSDDARIWKSTDGGTTWSMLTNGLPMEPYSRIGIAIDELNPQHLVAVYVNTNLEFGGLYETQNGGSSWSLRPSNGLDPGFMSNFGWYFGKVFINPFKSSEQWVLGVTGWASTNAGQDWTDKLGWQTDVHADKHDMAFITATTMLVATDGGLYKSTNGGNTWNKIENIPTTQFYRAAYNPHDPDNYYGGAQDNGTMNGSKASINDWQRLFGGDGFQAVFHPTNPNIYYFETQNGGIAGTNDGFDIQDATDGIDGSDRRHWDMQYFISPNDPDMMVTGTYRVYSGIGHLPFWSPVSDDLTDGDIFGARFHTISTLNESPLEAGLVYVGTTDGNVWSGNILTSQWTNRNAGLPDRYVSCVKASPSVADRIFVSHTGYKDGNWEPLIHRSDDRGATWIPINGDLPGFAINDICVLPGYQDSVIFVGTDVGVYGTRNGGQHWERLGTALPFTPIYDLDINAHAKQLIAGSYGRSILSYPLDSLQLGIDVSTFDPLAALSPSLTAFPSLFSGTLSLDLDRIKPSAITEVLVINMAGQLMHQEVSEKRGQLQLDIDAQNWAKGTYFVIARTNGKMWGHQKVIKGL